MSSLNKLCVDSVDLTSCQNSFCKVRFHLSCRMRFCIQQGLRVWKFPSMKTANAMFHVLKGLFLAPVHERQFKFTATCYNLWTTTADFILFSNLFMKRISNVRIRLYVHWMYFTSTIKYKIIFLIMLSKCYLLQSSYYSWI